MKPWLFCVIVLLLTGCGPQREPISASIIQESDAHCDRISSAHADFWSSHDTDLFGEVYTEDIIHDDSGTIEGAGDVSGMASTVFLFFPGLQTRATSLFIAGEECLGVYEYFPLELGGYEFTEEDPLIEIDLLRPREDRIFYWGLFESHETIKKQFLDNEGYQRLEADRRLLEAYAEAWSSTEIDRIAELYTSEAARKDLTFAEQQSGIDEIRSFAGSFFKLNPGIAWELQMPFSGDLSGMQVAGGTFLINTEKENSGDCVIEAAVLLWKSGQEILEEAIFYNANSLIACGWAK